MKKGIIAALAALIVATGGWYFVSPGMAMQGLKDAALVGDKDELNERVDFPAVRESLKSQLRAHITAEMAKEPDNPFGAMGMAFAMAIIDPMVDTIVSADGIKAMVENGKAKAPGAESPTNAKEANWSIERVGLDKFVAHPDIARDEKPTSLVFRRNGLGWDLVAIEVEGNSGEES